MQGQTTTNELKQILRQRDEVTRQHISLEFRQHELSLSEKEHRQKYLESLWFPEINAREENIKDAHKDTYDWIFPTHENSAPRWSDLRWSDFNQWLESGKGIYWISGKAGSGKSTLMRYICDHDQTSSSLKAWSAPMDYILVTHFFWKPGNTLQKTFEGLYRSLLHQILSQHPHLIPTLISKQPQQLSDHQLIAAWTDVRLKAALSVAIEELSRSHNLCFLIDGLDELDQDHDELVTFIKAVLVSERAKVCLSSRPLRCFCDAFSSSPMLRLQDLTKDDITKYVFDSLDPQTSSQIAPLAERSAFDASWALTNGQR